MDEHHNLLIPKSKLGERGYKKIFKYGIWVSSGLLIVTLAEQFPIFSRFIYLAIPVCAAFYIWEIIFDYKQNHYLTKGKLGLYGAFYIMLMIMFFVVINFIQLI